MLASGNGNGGEEGVFINFYSEIVDSPDLSSGNWVRLGEHSAADIDHWSMFLKSEELALLFSGPETWKLGGFSSRTKNGDALREMGFALSFEMGTMRVYLQQSDLQACKAFMGARERLVELVEDGRSRGGLKWKKHSK
ncbi:hypothetical protein ScalyP_jg662, partial [Parmales sp. scaly parma]